MQQKGLQARDRLISFLVDKEDGFLLKHLWTGRSGFSFLYWLAVRFVNVYLSIAGGNQPAEAHVALHPDSRSLAHSLQIRRGTQSQGSNSGKKERMRMDALNLPLSLSYPSLWKPFQSTFREQKTFIDEAFNLHAFEYHCKQEKEKLNHFLFPGTCLHRSTYYKIHTLKWMKGRLVNRHLLHLIAYCTVN